LQGATRRMIAVEVRDEAVPVIFTQGNAVVPSRAPGLVAGLRG
jgi:hypothetical protein